MRRRHHLLPALLLLAWLAACARLPQEPQRTLTPVDFAELPGWEREDPRPALAAFLRGCRQILTWDAAAPMDPAGDPRFGTVGDWQRLCRLAERVELSTAADARQFLEDQLRPFRVGDGRGHEGLFTGYFEPELEGALRPDQRFRYPLYRRPPELVEVDLGLFREDLRGRRIAGRVDEAGRLRPFPDRAAIEAGALAGRGLELLWVDDPIDLFFLHIQGSGRVRLPDGRRLRVVYAGQNGHPYRAIGRDLVAMGALAREEVSLLTIRAWLEAHPGEATALMQRNPSYVFFRLAGEVREGEGPPGSLGVPLTPARSIAVDRRYWPLGIPFFLDLPVPFPEGERPWRALVVAQDTGGAIRGPLRADIFWGAGERAAWIAGHMKQRGRMWVLLPRSAGRALAGRGMPPSDG